MRRTILLTAALLAAAPSAHAWQDTEPATDWSALTLHQNEWRMGLFRGQYGILEPLQIGTQWLPWLLKVPNVDLKWTVWSDRTWSASVSGAFFTVNAQDFDKDAEDIQFTMVPIELTGSWRGDALAAHLRLSYTVVKTTGDASVESADTDIKGVAAVSTGALGLSGEWHLSRSFALVTELAASIYQDAKATGESSSQIDPRTTLELHAGGSADLKSGRLANGTLSAFWSWATFNLKLGLGYGNYQVPTLHLFAGDPVVFPDLDMFWRF